MRPKAKRKDTHWKRFNEFVKNCSGLFEIKGFDKRIKAQEEIWKVKMTEADRNFYENMRSVSQIGYCGRTDTGWAKTQKRKHEREEWLEQRRKAAAEESTTSLLHSDIDLVDEEMDTDNKASEEIDDEFSAPEETRTKYVFNSSMVDDADDDLPFRLRHIRTGLRLVRPEYYVAMHKLKAEFHMSENQVQGAICTVANLLFERKDHGEWKRYEMHQLTDYNTLPAMTNTNRTEAYVEALILAAITHEIMSPDTETVVTYSNDGFAQSGWEIM